MRKEGFFWRKEGRISYFFFYYKNIFLVFPTKSLLIRLIRRPKWLSRCPLKPDVSRRREAAEKALLAAAGADEAPALWLGFSFWMCFQSFFEKV